MFAIGYVCGALCADGSIVLDRKYGHYRICLETKERGFADLFRYYLSPYVEKEVRIYERNKKYRGAPYHTFIVSVYGKKMVIGFKDRWGIETGSFTWVVPDMAFIDTDFRRGFLQGFFDGEATVRVRLGKFMGIKRRNVRITSANLTGLAQVKELLETCGIRSIVYPAGKYWCLDIEGKARLVKFREKVNFGIPKKRKKLDFAISGGKSEPESLAFTNKSVLK